MSSRGIPRSARSAAIRPTSSRQTIGPVHQYPDGFALFLGTMFAPVKDRDAPGQGFTHKRDDIVTIAAPKLGKLVNRMRNSDDCEPWTFGVGALMKNSARGRCCETGFVGWAKRSVPTIPSRALDGGHGAAGFAHPTNSARHREERSVDAIHLSTCGAMDCFASLAMTMWRALLRQNNPTGKSAKTCPALQPKIFRLTRRANQRYQLARLTR